ncbi:trypsin-like serine protease [Streptomyces sp. NPDC001339]|uniref:trypsin-like serine protease n=1 Tax=Streptomyces sp. NPDC001339 TaxID=3364563 RepID=UPI0036B690B2
MRATLKRRTGFAALVAAAAIGAPAISAHAVTGDAEKDNTRGFTARLDIGNGTKACTGALIDPQWLVTAASCFADNPAQSIKIPAGAPKARTTATIGRTDLTTTAGSVRDVVQLVPHEDRDIVLAKLSAPVTNVRPAQAATAAPKAGDKLTFTGYGRTKDEWAPLKAHNGTFGMQNPAGGTVEGQGENGAAVCAGDAGGPLFTTSGDQSVVAAVASRSDQGGCFGIDPANTSTRMVGTRVDDLAAWINSAVSAAPFVDFNGDGVEDNAIADRHATVAGKTKAGAVHIVYGGGKGTQQVDQNQSFVPGGAEADDMFGSSLATVDYNQDGYTDLVVGIPDEDIGSAKNAGMVTLVYGSPDGLGKGKASENFEQGKGNGELAKSVPEADDYFGHSLTAGVAESGYPYIAIGVPGEDIGKVSDAGGFFFLSGGTSFSLGQDNDGVPGAAEAGDNVGWSMAGDDRHLVVGTPYEDIEARKDAGAAYVFKLPAQAGQKPVYTHGVTESAAGGATAGARFGESVSVVSYLTSSGARESVFAVGAPGDTVNKRAGAGSVTTFRIDSAGKVTKQDLLYQGKDGIVGGAETDDHFGQTVAAVNTAPNKAGSRETVRLAVGAPDEALEDVTNAGAVHIIPLIGGNPGDGDVWVQEGPDNAAGIPTPFAKDRRFGRVLAVTGTHLNVGVPGPGSGIAYSVPWANLYGGPKQPVTVFQPGKDGIPAGGVSFGSALPFSPR